MNWHCPNGHRWLSEEIEIGLFQLDGDGGQFLVAGVDPSVCPLCFQAMESGGDWMPFMPIAPLPNINSELAALRLARGDIASLLRERARELGLKV